MTSKYQIESNMDTYFCVKVKSLYKIIKSTQNSLQTDLTFFPKTNGMSVVKIFQQVYKEINLLINVHEM